MLLRTSRVVGRRLARACVPTGALQWTPRGVSPAGLATFQVGAQPLCYFSSSSTSAGSGEEDHAAGASPPPPGPVTKGAILEMMTNGKAFDQGVRPRLAQVVEVFNEKISQETLLAAHEGEREAMIQIGQMMVSQQGFGLIPRDMQRGKEWLRKAARKGSVEALEMLTRISQMEQMELLKRTPPPPSPPRASTIWSRGCTTRNFDPSKHPDKGGR